MQVQLEEIQTEEAETETEETETGEIETEEIETEEVEIEETEIEETETEESKDRHKKSVNLNTTEQIKDLAGRILPSRFQLSQLLLLPFRLFSQKPFHPFPEVLLCCSANDWNISRYGITNSISKFEIFADFCISTNESGCFRLYKNVGLNSL